jgi:hypothetical protein
MGLKGYELGGESSATVKGTAVESTYPEFVFNAQKGEEKYEEVTKKSTLGNGYKGGNFFGFNIEAKEKSSFTFYDNAKEEEKNRIWGPVYAKEKADLQIIFPYPLKFENALYVKVAEGKLTGECFCDVQ